MIEVAEGQKCQMKSAENTELSVQRHHFEGIVLQMRLERLNEHTAELPQFVEMDVDSRTANMHHFAQSGLGCWNAECTAGQRLEEDSGQVGSTAEKLLPGHLESGRLPIDGTIAHLHALASHSGCSMAAYTAGLLIDQLVVCTAEYLTAAQVFDTEVFD